MKEQVLLKLIDALLGSDESTVGDNKKQIGSSLVGEFVICRSRNEGINAGTVEEMDDTGVVLSGVRRIWFHRPKDVNTSWYEGVSISGLSDDSKVSCTVEKKVIVEDYSLTVCTQTAKDSILGKVPNGQD